VKIILRTKDGEELEAFVEELSREFPELERREDRSLEPAPALGIGNISFHGVPRGREAGVFREILRKCTGASWARENLVEVKIFTTPTCRFCEKAVSAAAELSMMGKRLRLMVYDATWFAELAEEYEVTSVPKIVIAGRLFIESHTTREGYRRLILGGLQQLGLA